MHSWVYAHIIVTRNKGLEPNRSLTFFLCQQMPSLRSDDKRLILSRWSSNSSQYLDLPMFGIGWLLVLFLDPLRLVILISQWSGLAMSFLTRISLLTSFLLLFFYLGHYLHQVSQSIIAAFEILRHDIEPYKWEYIGFMDYKHFETWYPTFKI